MQLRNPAREPGAPAAQRNIYGYGRSFDLCRPLLKAGRLTSAILAAAIALVWIWSYRSWDSVLWTRPATIQGVAVAKDYELELESGVVFLRRDFLRFSSRDAPWPMHGFHREPIILSWDSLGPTAANKLGFYYSYRFDPGIQAWNIGRSDIGVPLWSPFILFCIAPLHWAVAKLRSRRWERRRSRGLCANCGYDLRATPGHCPECGLEERSGRA
jgi:hypothetical protein